MFHEVVRSRVFTLKVYITRNHMEQTFSGAVSEVSTDISEMSAKARAETASLQEALNQMKLIEAVKERHLKRIKKQDAKIEKLSGMNAHLQNEVIDNKQVNDRILSEHADIDKLLTSEKEASISLASENESQKNNFTAEIALLKNELKSREADLVKSRGQKKVLRNEVLRLIKEATNVENLRVSYKSVLMRIKEYFEVMFKDESAN